jgi:hypothetical protein
VRRNPFEGVSYFGAASRPLRLERPSQLAASGNFLLRDRVGSLPVELMSYYISIAFRWETYKELQDEVEKFCKSVPDDYDVIPEKSRHSTLFAVAQFIDSDPSSAPEVLRALLKGLPFDDIEKILRRYLDGTRFQAYELRKYEQTWSIQFYAEADIKAMRKDLLELFRDFRSKNNLDRRVECPMTAPSKNESGLVWGSFARNRKDVKNTEPEKKDMKGFAWFRPSSVEITVSNDELTNDREEDVDYKIVSLS